MKVLSGKLTRAHTNDAGSDIHCTSEHTILPKDSAIISTNLRIVLEPNTFGLIKSRSGLSFKYNLEVGAGVIDESYEGEIKVHLYNHGDETYRVNKGDKIAQIIVLLVIYPTNNDTLPPTMKETRGTKGFGSSGK